MPSHSAESGPRHASSTPKADTGPDDATGTVAGTAADKDDAGPELSGERFTALYRIRADDRAVAESRARAICVEQTVEFPPSSISNPRILNGIIGEVASLESVGDRRFAASIHYPVEAAGTELTQLINVLFGNVSLQPDVQLFDFTLPGPMLSQYRGPRFGVGGLRDLVAVRDRPLLCTALKPMGLPPRDLAALAYRLAVGGVDLIKDDHGLSDQPFCPFEQRVARCAEAVERANRQTGRHCLYLPNVTAPAATICARARFARQAGAGGLLFCPGLAGLDAMRTLADDDAIALPILSHPAFQGSLMITPHAGLSHRLVHGRLNRLAGADGAIFPSYGGRFAYTPEQCRDVLRGTTGAMSGLRPLLPVPAGGMRLERIGQLVAFYGRDCMLLIGGDLHGRGTDLIQSCRRFLQLTADAAAALPH